MGLDQEGIDQIKKEFRQQVGVLSVEFQSRISAVIEGQDSLKRELGAEIGSVRSELSTEIGTVRSEVGQLSTEIGSVRSEQAELRTEVGSFRSTMEREFEETRAMIRLSYRAL